MRRRSVEAERSARVEVEVCWPTGEAPARFASFNIPGNPIGAPRMTHSDQWQQRPRVVAYRAWKDLARACASPAFRDLGEGWDAGTVMFVAYFSMPARWSAKKRAEMAGQPHRVKPDTDNVEKALLDALFTRDQGVHSVSKLKRWDDGAGARLFVVVAP
jgi:hypothetical protein